MASLFDGIGGFPLAAERYGITPIWASEIEKFPMAVTKYHFPNMVHMGDITKLDGAKLPPVDILTGGSPCQDISVANGSRRGLDGSRSSLFYEQIRIIREMRDEDKRCGRTAQFIRPRFCIWENVPGVFHCNDPPTETFRIVLEEFLRIADDSVVVPGPPTGRWESAGAVLGVGYSLAWRVLDAQYWPGTPQRRRRVYIVVDLGGLAAPQVLFEPHCLSWNPAPSGEAGQTVAACAGAGPADTGGDPTEIAGAVEEGSGSDN
jgi:DNA (cytosine-5)-methyltransferase 1